MYCHKTVLFIDLQHGLIQYGKISNLDYLMVYGIVIPQIKMERKMSATELLKLY